MAGPSFEQLSAERYVSLMTFRRNGNGVPIPIWVAPADGKLYAVTNGKSAKMKRLRNSDRVRLAACDGRGKVRGEWTEGKARRVDDPAVIDRATAALLSKYGWQVRVADFFTRVSGRAKDRAFVEI